LQEVFEDLKDFNNGDAGQALKAISGAPIEKIESFKLTKPLLHNGTATTLESIS